MRFILVMTLLSLIPAFFHYNLDISPYFFAALYLGFSIYMRDRMIGNQEPTLAAIKRAEAIYPRVSDARTSWKILIGILLVSAFTGLVWALSLVKSGTFDNNTTPAYIIISAAVAYPGVAFFIHLLKISK